MSEEFTVHLNRLIRLTLAAAVSLSSSVFAGQRTICPNAKPEPVYFNFGFPANSGLPAGETIVPFELLGQTPQPGLMSDPLALSPRRLLSDPNAAAAPGYLVADGPRAYGIPVFEKTSFAALAQDGRSIARARSSGSDDRFLAAVALGRFDGGKNLGAAVLNDMPAAQPPLPAIGSNHSPITDGRDNGLRPAMAARIAVGPETFGLATGDDVKILDFLDLKGISDPQERMDVWNAFSGTYEWTLRYVLDSPENPKYPPSENAGPETREQYEEELKKDLEAFKAKFSAVIREHFESTLARYEHSVEERNGIRVYIIPRGLEFWAELISPEDPDRRMAALAKRYGLILSRRDRYLHIGGGAGFFILQQVLSAARKLVDPLLIARFNRALRFLAATGIGVIAHAYQGAAAFYDPLGDTMAYVMPSRGDVETTAHEINHARFHRFEVRLRRWLKARGYALPYEVDGPLVGLSDMGAFMNLFNELNSWRIGRSFGDKAGDAEILRTLRQAYGPQAGWDNVRLFAEIWSARKVAGRSVPRIILDSVRRLNGVKNEDLDSFGREALRQKDVIQAHDFLRLIKARYPKLEGIGAGQLQVLKQYAEHSDPDVSFIARRLLGVKEGTQRGGEDKADMLAPLLDDRTPREAKEKRLAKLLRWSLTEDGKETAGRQQRAVELIKELFEHWGFSPIVERERLDEVNRLGGKNEFKNRPPPPIPAISSPWKAESSRCLQGRLRA